MHSWIRFIFLNELMNVNGISTIATRVVMELNGSLSERVALRKPDVVAMFLAPTQGFILRSSL
jgi:hypothetical protein